jgi:hypothetical protein
MEVTMPETVEDAANRCGQLTRLATATEWELAAILATHVNPGEGQGTSVTSDRSRKSGISAREFVETYKIRSLKSHNTILKYVAIWTEHVGTRPKPGEVIKLPTKDWPGTRTGTNGYNTVEGATTTVKNIAEKHGSAPFTQAARQSRKAHSAQQDAIRSENTRQFHEMTRDQDRDSTGGRLKSAADMIAPSDRENALSAVYRITVQVRVIEDYRPNLNKRDRKEVAQKLYEAADRVRMEADAYATDDMDSELQDILAGVEPYEE